MNPSRWPTLSQRREGHHRYRRVVCQSFVAQNHTCFRLHGSGKSRLSDPVDFLRDPLILGMPERLQQHRHSRRVRRLRRGRELESAQRVLAPERGDRHQELKIGPDGIRQRRARSHPLTLFMRHLAEVQMRRPAPDRMVWNRDVFDQHVQDVVLPLARKARKHRAKPESAEELPQFLSVHRRCRTDAPFAASLSAAGSARLTARANSQNVENDGVGAGSAAGATSSTPRHRRRDAGASIAWSSR